jgi:hypothetical protein
MTESDADLEAEDDRIGCHHPFCNEKADELAYDSVTKVNIGFCENHGRYWFRQDHIKRGGSA